MSADFRRISLTLGKGTIHISGSYYMSKIVPKAYHKISNEIRTQRMFSKWWSFNVRMKAV
jgi:hypothetical protein